MTPRRLKCTRFPKGILDFSLECITLLQNDFFKQRYITFNVTIPGQDIIDPNTHRCRTFLTGYIYRHNIYRIYRHTMDASEIVLFCENMDKITLVPVCSHKARLLIFENKDFFMIPNRVNNNTHQSRSF